MVFSSLTFLFVFLPLILVIYFAMPNRTLKNLVLFLSSLVFYAWGEPIYIALILISTLNDYTFARLVQVEKDRDNDGRAKIYFIISLVVNLGLLGFFKYSGFIVENMNELLNAGIEMKELPLPIGISFYTFQTMSYSIDVYMGNVRAQRKFLPMATYVALFPQLIAGPIVRYIDVEEELTHRNESVSQVSSGLRRFIIGLGKKVIIANQMGFIADTVFNNAGQNPGTVMTWIAVLCYAFQIYYDFSGYSDMAIGLGRVFGFHFLENFNYPYVSKNITEFWRRWHISLGTWFRDYLYIPLGGNRSHPLRNLLIVWFLTGLWHGASWNYILWGLYYGILIMLEKYFFGKGLAKLPNIVQHGYALFFILVGWALFRIENLDQLGSVLQTMFIYKGTTIKTLLFTYQDMWYAMPFILPAIIGSMPWYGRLQRGFAWNKELGEKKEPDMKKEPVLKKESKLPGITSDIYLVGVFLVSIVFLLGERFNPFIYFRF